jgi:hypothetical protein
MNAITSGNTTNAAVQTAVGKLQSDFVSQFATLQSHFQSLQTDFQSLVTQLQAIA